MHICQFQVRFVEMDIEHNNIIKIWHITLHEFTLTTRRRVEVCAVEVSDESDGRRRQTSQQWDSRH